MTKLLKRDARGFIWYWNSDSLRKNSQTKLYKYRKRENMRFYFMTKLLKGDVKGSI